MKGRNDMILELLNEKLEKANLIIDDDIDKRDRTVAVLDKLGLPTNDFYADADGFSGIGYQAGVDAGLARNDAWRLNRGKHIWKLCKKNTEGKKIAAMFKQIGATDITSRMCGLVGLRDRFDLVNMVYIGCKCSRIGDRVFLHFVDNAASKIEDMSDTVEIPATVYVGICKEYYKEERAS